MIVDKVNIEASAGNGGGGLVSFHKEKYKPFGGPDGGDGGKGGDVLLAADKDMDDLASFKHKRIYRAMNGQSGGSNKMHGADAENLIVKVPVGTTVLLRKEGIELLLADLYRDGQKVIVAAGGKGGKGNVHFATATRKAPRVAQPGLEGESAELILKLRLPVDVAIIGLPNSGKSSLLSAFSAARPKVAEYPYTTREPVLGVVDRDLKSYTWAELPAIAPDAHAGKGLGNSQLVHAERAKVIIYLIDITSGSIENDLKTLVEETRIFQPELLMKKGVIVLNKTDRLPDAASIAVIKEQLSYGNMPVFPVSSKGKAGLDELVSEVHRMAGEEKLVSGQGIKPEVVFRPKPVDGGRR